MKTTTATKLLLMTLLVHIFLSIFGVADVPFHPLIVDAYLVNDQGTADHVDDEH